MPRQEFDQKPMKCFARSVSDHWHQPLFKFDSQTYLLFLTWFYLVWGQLKPRPNYIAVQHLYWTYLLQDATANHTSGGIIVFRKFPKTDFLKQSRSHGGVWYHNFYPIEWLWHYVYYIWPRIRFSIIIDRFNVELIFNYTPF